MKDQLCKKLTILKFKVFQSPENFEIIWGDWDHNFVSEYRKFCVLCGELQFCLSAQKFGMNNNFVSQCRKFLGVPP